MPSYRRIINWVRCHKKQRKLKRMRQKPALSHLVWEIPNVFMHHQLNKKLRQSMNGYESDWLARTVVNNGLDLNKKFRNSFLIRTIWVGLLSYRTFIITIRLIQVFSNPLHCPQFYDQTHGRSSVVNAKEYSIPFPNLRKTSELHSGADFHTDRGQLILVWFIGDKIWRK